MDIVNNAAMNIGVHISFLISFLFSSDKYSDVELLDHMVVLFLIFEEPPYCFPSWLHRFIIPPTGHESPLFPISLTLVFSCLFDNSHSNRSEVISHCGFELHFLDD